MNYNVNYERYPPEYFSGSNIHVFFEDIYIDEIVSLQFNLVEKVRPNYGYNSYTYDNIMRGNRIVQGAFRINFKRVNYIRNAVETILGNSETQETESNFSQYDIENKKDELYNVAKEGWGRQFEELSESFKKTIWDQSTVETSKVKTDQPYFNFNGSFNILVKYGPYDRTNRDLPRYRNEQLFMDNVSNGTVIKIIDVQLKGLSQSVDASGKPIGENYSFLAKDLSREQETQHERAWQRNSDISGR